MTGWMLLGLFLSVLMAIGGWTDWKRRYPQRGIDDGPPAVRRASAPDRNPPDYGGHDVGRP